MLARPVKLFLLSGFSISLLLGPSAAFAQTNSSGSVVVPTVPGNGTTSTTTTTGNGTTTTTTNSSTTIDSGTRFSCQFYNGQYTVMYQPETQANQYYPWAVPRTLGGGWDAQKRCVTIAQRLESYRPDGLIDLSTSTLNGYNIICVTSEANPACRIVLTVPQEKDPLTVRNSVFQNLATADSGQQTIGVNTYTNRSGGRDQIEELYNAGRSIFGGRSRSRTTASSRGPINLKPFLAPEDGGTARNLRNGVTLGGQKTPSQSKMRLNPDRFR